MLFFIILMLLNEGTQRSNPLHPQLMEIKPIPLSISDLQQIIIQSLLHDSYFRCRSIKIHMHCLSFLIKKSSIQLPPQCHFLNNFPYTLLFLLCLWLSFSFVIIIFLFLLLFQLLQSTSYLSSEAEFDVGLAVGVAECEFMNFLLVFLLAEQVRLSEIRSNDEAENVDFSGLVIVAD